MIGEAQKLSPNKIIVACHNEWMYRLPDDNRIMAVSRRGGYIRDLFRIVDSCVSDFLLIVNADAVLINAEIMSKLITLVKESEAGFI